MDRVVVRDGRATGVVDADGLAYEAEMVVLAAGAYFSPAILMRSGIGPEYQLERLAIPLVQDLPVGTRLLDHCGATLAWAPSETLLADAERRTRVGHATSPLTHS